MKNCRRTVLAQSRERASEDEIDKEELQKKNWLEQSTGRTSEDRTDIRRAATEAVERSIEGTNE